MIATANILPSLRENGDLASQPAVISDDLDVDSLTDEKLLARYRRSRDATAFAELVRRHEKPLYRFLVRFLDDREAAEDVFQATFMQVHLKGHLFDERRAFRPWLYKVATNQAIDAQRRGRRHAMRSLDATKRGEPDQRVTLLDTIEAREASPGDAAANNERSQWLRETVACLPEPLRAAVQLVHFQGLKYHEAADRLAIPLGTLKSRMHAAIGRLRESNRIRMAAEI